MPNLRPLTAAQELRLKALKKAFADHLARAIVAGMRAAKDGRMQLNYQEITLFLDRAYLQGREDA
jgi:hypothetical protein